MLDKPMTRCLAGAGILFCMMMMMTGCNGSGNKPTLEDAESSTNPPFEMPGESVIEVTPNPDKTETTTQEAETIWITNENGTETQTQMQTVGNTGGTHVVVLDPGHGGIWLGALDGDYMEKNLALKTAMYCRDYLLTNYNDVEVYLTRDTDMEFSYDQKSDLEERVRIASSYNAEILVSLHFNTESTDECNGSLVCISKQSWVHASGEALGNSILNQLTKLGLESKGLLERDSDEYFDENGVAMDYYAICRHSASLGINGVIVEHCFMRNSKDVVFYRTDEALQRLGQADAVGIAEYLGLSKR